MDTEKSEATANEDQGYVTGIAATDHLDRRCHGCAERLGEDDGLCNTCRATTSLTYALDDATQTANTRRLINLARDDLMALGGIPTV